MAEVLKNKQVNIRQISDNLQNLSTLHPSYSLLSFYYYESPKNLLEKALRKLSQSLSIQLEEIHSNW